MNKQSSGINTKLNLKYDKTYFSLIRATLKSGTQLVGISSGVTVIRQDFEHENLIFTSFVTEKLSERSTADTIVPCQCSIDENNRIAQSKVPVSDRLNEIYGPPNFLTDQLVELVVYGSINRENNGDDDDDDDNQAPAWILAPVIVGAFLFYCLILILALLGILLFRRSRGPAEEGQSNVSFNESKKEAKSYGQREGMDVVDATTETRVEFPDTNIRRLSISHNDPPLEDLGVAEDSGRGRKHPIMSSASSSFRDYRSSVSH